MDRIGRLAFGILLFLGGCVASVIDVSPTGGTIEGTVLRETRDFSGKIIEPGTGSSVGISENTILGCWRISDPCATVRADGSFTLANVPAGSHTLYAFRFTQSCSSRVSVTDGRVAHVAELTLKWGSGSKADSSCR